MAYDNTNKGALFGNNRKREGKKDPDLQGKIDIAGTEYWLSGWFFVYEDKQGQKKRGINISLGQPVNGTSKPPKAGGHFDDMKDDLPF